MESRESREEPARKSAEWREGTQRAPENPKDEREAERAQEREAVEERKAISVRVVYEAILAEGKEELKRPTSALAFSGLAAGLSTGFSFLSQGFLQASLPRTGWAELIAKLGYSIGFLIVILGRQQLFTENTLTPIIPLLKYKNASLLWNTLRLWVAVFIANWIGTMLLAWVLAQSPVINEAARPTFLELGRHAIQHGFWTTVLKAIFAGWLIALLIWLMPFAESARVGVIILMTYVIALGSFSHVIAGSVDTFYLVALGDISFWHYLGQFMAPTLVGNIVGGTSLVAVLNHAQVQAGTE